MKNLMLTLLVVPLMCLGQLNGADLQMIEVDATKVLVDQGFYVEDEGVLVPARNFILRNKKVLALVEDRCNTLDPAAWIFVFPPDAVKHSPTRPMLSVEKPSECNCGKKDLSRVKGAMHDWLQNIFERSADRQPIIVSKGGCGCKPPRGGRRHGQYYLHEKSGDVLVSITIETDESSLENNPVRIYIEDADAVEIILQSQSNSAGAEVDEFEDTILGYDFSGAYYYNPNSFFQVHNPTQYNPHR